MGTNNADKKPLLELSRKRKKKKNIYVHLLIIFGVCTHKKGKAQAIKTCNNKSIRSYIPSALFFLAKLIQKKSCIRYIYIFHNYKFALKLLIEPKNSHIFVPIKDNG